jgi:3-oxoacyl-[acyl-carrier protein] reductase/pyridoxal 4-dehydrogenase
MGKMDNRVAIVTGAAQGIANAVARKLAAEGAAVVVADRNGEGAEKAAGKLPESMALEIDVSRPDDVQRMVDETLSRYGKVDGLAHCAAIVPFTPWEDVTFEEWRRIIGTNLDGTYLTNRAVYGPMREAGYGRIVNISTNAMLAGTPNLAHYIASKGGVLAFTRALAREVGKYGITVNSVAPGLTASEGVLASPHKEAFEFVQMLQCIPRRGESEDIAPAVAFLLSEEAGWITGQLLVADGGMSHD